MIDLHMHTLFSDGELIPAELMRRAENIGYEYMAITDHVDISNYDFIVPRLITAADELNGVSGIQMLPGAEITHAPPQLIKGLADKIRALGAKLIVVHGETISEPVMPGTNMAAVLSDIDILAHPGLVDDETCKIAADRGIHFEITARKGHSLTNGHVAKMAQKYGIKMVINSDTHGCNDMLTKDTAKRVLLGASIPKDQIDGIFLNSQAIVKKLL